MTTGTSKRPPLTPIPWLGPLKEWWESARSKLFVFLVGLMAGPLVSNLAGWQVTSGTAHAQLQSGLLAQEASNCEARARGEAGDTSKLDWAVRRTLATKWALIPGATSADSHVVSECARKLRD